MTAFKCKMCGAPLEVEQGATSVTCDYCRTQQTLPRGSELIAPFAAQSAVFHCVVAPLGSATPARANSRRVHWAQS